jgi:hypothetical protein
MVMMAEIIFKAGLVLIHFMVEPAMTSFQEAKGQTILTADLEEIA